MLVKQAVQLGDIVIKGCCGVEGDSVGENTGSVGLGGTGFGSGFGFGPGLNFGGGFGLGSGLAFTGTGSE